MKKAVTGILSVCIFILSGCEELKDTFAGKTPHEEYVTTLRNAGLAETSMGRKWISASTDVIGDSVQISTPFKESGFFNPSEIQPAGYRISMEEGQELIVDVSVNSPDSVQLFADLFFLQNEEGSEYEHLQAAEENSRHLEHEADEEGVYFLRLQAELLADLKYTLTITKEPVYTFPVQGKSSRNIASYWGAPRGGGARQHEGVDIFAVRGTPAIAVTDGVARPEKNDLGGNVVFIADRDRQNSIYYAHLDSQNVNDGENVSTGDTIGFIGNTGNARTTSPHLHFGIYSWNEGAVNPFPYIHEPDQEPPEVQYAPEPENNMGITEYATHLRSGPSSEASVLQRIPQNTILKINAGAKEWYRASLPDNTSGYIPAQSLSFKQELFSRNLKKPVVMYFHPDENAMIKDTLSENSEITISGSFRGYYLAKTGNTSGWVEQSM